MSVNTKLSIAFKGKDAKILAIVDDEIILDKVSIEADANIGDNWA